MANRYVLFRLEQHIADSKVPRQNIVDRLRKVASIRRFDWNCVKLCSGEQDRKQEKILYAILEEPASKGEQVSQAFTQIVLEGVDGEPGIEIRDEQTLLLNPPAGRADEPADLLRHRFVLFRYKKQYSYPKADSIDPVNGFREIALKRGFDWNSIWFHTDGKGGKDFYFLMREDVGENNARSIMFLEIERNYGKKFSIVNEEMRELNPWNNQYNGREWDR